VANFSAKAGNLNRLVTEKARLLSKKISLALKMRAVKE
jgi:hypothetical protein